MVIATSRIPSTAIGSEGDRKGLIAWGDDFIYVCTQDYDGITSIWKRTQISSW
jgi:hypothetical protein